MTCAQNNVLASLLLANKSTRNIILPLLESYTKKEAAAVVNGINSASAYFAKNNLQAHIYESVMFGEKADIYKPLLMDKFAKGFSARGYYEGERLQKVLQDLNLKRGEPKQLDKESKQIDSALSFLKEVGLADDTFSLTNATDSIQRKLILEYASGYGKGFKIGTKTVTKSQWLKYYSTEKELPESVTRDPIYKTIQELNKTKSPDVTNKLYAKYRAIMMGDETADVKIGTSSINKQIKETDDIEWLSNLLVQNIEDNKVVNAVTKRLDELRGTEDNISIIIQSIAKGDSDMISRMHWSLKQKLDYLNTIHTTDVGMSTFEGWLKKIPKYQEVESELNNAINAQVNKMIEDWAIASGKKGTEIPNAMKGTLIGFFRNYYQSARGTEGFGVMNKLAGTEFTDPKKLIFVNVPLTATDDTGKNISKVFSDSKLSYRIEGPEMEVVELDNLSAYLKSNPEIEGIIVQSRSMSEDARLIDASGDHLIVSTTSNGTIFDMYDGKIVMADDNFNRINNIKNNAIRDGYYTKITLDGERTGKALDEYLELVFPERTAVQRQMLKDMLPENPSATDLENMVRIASTVNRNSQLQYVNLKHIREDVTDGDVVMFLRDLGVDGENIPEEITDVMKDLYMEAKYANGASPYASLAEGRSKLFSEIGLSKDLLPDATNADLSYVMLKGLFDKGFSTTTRGQGIDEFSAMIKGGGRIEDASGYEFWDNLLQSNRGEDVDEMFKTIKESIDAYEPSVSAKSPKGGFDNYIVIDNSRYGVHAEDLMASIGNIKKMKVKQYQESADVFHKNINNAIDEYTAEVTERLSKLGEGKQLPYRVARSMKQKLVNSLMENEMRLQDLGAMKGKTYTYSVSSVYTLEGQQGFEESMRLLKERYGITVDDMKLKSEMTPGDMIDVGEDAIIINGKNSVIVQLDELIKRELADMPSQIIIDVPQMNKFEKADFYNAIVAAKKQFILNNGIQKTIADKYLKGLGQWIEDYKNVVVEVDGGVYNMPQALVLRNTAGEINEGISKSADFFAKYDILRDVTTMMKKQTMQPSDLENIITNNLTKHGINEDGMIDAYMGDFFNYTLVPQMDNSILKEAQKLMQPPQLTNSQSFIYNNIKYIDEAGETKFISTMPQDIKTDEFPDILYKTKNENPLGNIMGGIEVDKEVVKRNVLLAIDDAYNGMKQDESFDGFILNTIRQEAKNVMKSAPRLKAADEIVSKMVNPGLIAADAFRPLAASVKTTGNTIAGWIGFNGGYDAKYLNKLINTVNDIMKLTDDQFKQLPLTKVDAGAYNLANYMRTLKKNISGLTTSKSVNASLVDDVNFLLDDIVEVVNGVAKIKDGKGLVGINKLKGLEKSMRHGAYLYGLRKLQDMDIRYMAKKGRFRGIGQVAGLKNQFYDEISELDPLAQFNELFNSNLSLNDYRVVVGSLVGDITDNALRAGGVLSHGWNVANSPLFRFISSMPGTGVVGIQSAAGYQNTILQMKKFNKSFNDWEGITELRTKLGVLGSSSADVDAIRGAHVLEVEHAIESAVDAAYHIGGFNQKALREFLGQGFDNGQNFIDGVYANAIKNESFISAIKSEGFPSIKDFTDFLDNPLIDKSTKTRMFNAINVKAYDMHEGLINYSGRATSKNIDTGHFKSRLNGVVSKMLTPINFRAGLGNNMIVNAVSNISNIMQHFWRYGGDINKVANTLGKDPNMMRFLYSIVQDTAMAIRLTNLNDYGEVYEEREMDWGDTMAALDMLSQPAQFVRMSAGFRVLASTMNSENDKTYTFLKEYSRNAFRQLRTAVGLLEGLRVGLTGDEANRDAYWAHFWNTISASSMRYMLQEGSKIIPVDTGIPPMFGGENKYQDAMYDDAINEKLFKQFWGEPLKEGEQKYTKRELGWKLARNIMLSGQGGRFAETVAKVGVQTIEAIDEPLGKRIAEKLGLEYKSLYVKPELAIMGFKQSEYADKIVDGKYKFYRLIPEAIGEDFKKYKIEVDTIRNEIMLDYTVGSEDFALMIDHFKETGDTEFTTSRGWNSYENPAMTEVLKDMQEKGVLDALYVATRTSNNKPETKGMLSNYMINYISQMDNKPMNYDQLQAQIENSYLYEQMTGSSVTKEYKDMGKAITGDKKYTLDDYEKVDINARFIQQRWDEYQRVVSDGYYSSAGVNVAAKIYAKNNPDALETIFNLDKEGNPTSMKPKYRKALENTYKLESDLAKGIPPTTAIQGIYGIYSLYAATVGGEYTQQANLEGVLHMHKFINSLGNLTNDEKASLRISTMTNMPIGALSIKDIEEDENLGPEVAEDYRRAINQSYQDAGAIMNAMMDAQRSKGTGFPSFSKVSVAELGGFMKSVEKYQSDNAADYWKPMKFTRPKLEAYTMSDRSQGEAKIRPPKAPDASSAKSDDLFTSPKPKKKPKLKAPKRKTSLKNIKV